MNAAWQGPAWSPPLGPKELCCLCNTEQFEVVHITPKLVVNGWPLPSRYRCYWETGCTHRRILNAYERGLAEGRKAVLRRLEKAQNDTINGSDTLAVKLRISQVLGAILAPPATEDEG